MSKISNSNSDKIKENLLSYLFESYPKMFYTYEIAEYLIRDDEFVLSLLLELDNNKLIKKFEESKGGKVRRKWGMSKDVYEKYKQLI